MQRTFLILFIAIFPLSLSAQDFSAYSYILAQAGKQPVPQIAQAALDSLEKQSDPKAGSISWDAVNVKMAPDSNWTLIQLIGEGCSLYCNPYVESYILEQNAKTAQYELYEWDIQEVIDTLFLIKPFEYCSIGTQSSRASGWQSFSYETTRTFRLNGNGPYQLNESTRILSQSPPAKEQTPE